MIENEIEVIELDSEKIESMIYYVRNQKVMLDFELAEIYGYETKRFNEQVKNNIEKFDKDFRFRLTKEEYENILRTKNRPQVGEEQDIYLMFLQNKVFIC